ncbi:EXS protein [Rhizoctonia solani]|uniref:EXS protein n=1 Tax=Rhizoctonia solani TaxID=456999 RepID=A0A8H7IEN7_9AGAM|nr:EXS protein [Rhizoctonia solani]
MAHHPPGYHESTSPTRTVAREPPSYEPDPALPLPTTFKVGKSYTPPLISVSSVRNHLSVLECFATLKRNVENAQPILTSEPLELDPEIKWAIYRSSQPPRGEVVELTNEEIPPIDVLLLWHAYLLNPVGYYEDCESRYPCLRLIGGFPLDRVASRMSRYEGRVRYMPRDSQIDEWELLTQEPFELPLWTTVSDTVLLTCPMCASPDLRIPWITEPTLEDIGDETAVGKGYAQSRFRIDCQACGGAVTKDKLRAERFVKEFVRVRREIRRGMRFVLCAALRQEKFTSQILSLAANFSVTDAITGYHSFLDLCAHNSSKALVPTLMIDLGWHTHMLSGEQYSKDCWRLFEKLVGHEDKVEEGKLGIFSPLFSFKVTKMSDTAASFDETARLWKSRFGGHYIAVNPKKGVSENRRSRAGSVSALKHRISSSAEHVQAFIGDYANADGRPFSSVGLRGWDIDCIRQPFVVNSDDDRGDCCVVRFLISVCLLGMTCVASIFAPLQGVRISCSTISHMSATGEGASEPEQIMRSMFAGYARSLEHMQNTGYASLISHNEQSEDAPFHVDLPVFHSSFPLPYRVFLLVGLGIFFWAANLHVLHVLGIDTIWVLDLRRDKVQSSSPPTPLPTARQPQLPYDLSSLEAVTLYKSVYKLFMVYGTWVGFGWLYFRLITAGDGEAMDMYKILPALTGAGIVVGLLCPLDVLMKRERMRFLRSLWRCLSSPSSDPVYFSDVILADVFTSFAKVIADVWISVCMILPKGTLLRAKTVGGISESLVPIMMALPYAIRFRQCMMEYIGSQRKSGRALANAIKYATAFPVIFLSLAQRTSPTGPLDAKPEGEISSSGYFDNKVFKLWLLAVVVNSVYSFWWDVTNDWGLTLLKPSTWPAQHAAMPPRSPLLRPPRSGRSSPPLILLSRTNSSAGLSAPGSTYSDADGIMRERAPYPFGLRDNLLFRDSLVYYLVIFLNLFLRFTWSLKLSTHLDTVEELESSVFLMEALEVTRRWVWVFFRVEWEAIKKEQAGDVSARIRPYTPNEEIEFDLMGSSRGPSRSLTPDPLRK